MELFSEIVKRTGSHKCEQGGENFKIVKRPCSLNRYYRVGKYQFNLYLLLTGYESSSCDDKNDGYDEHAYTLGTIHILCKHIFGLILLLMRVHCENYQIQNH